MKLIVKIFLLLSLVSANATAADNELINIKQIKCKTTSGILSTYKEDILTTEKQQNIEEYKYDKIDFNNKTATLIGKSGTSQVTVIYGNDMITFIELTPVGPIIDSIFADKTTKGKYKIVDSRHRNFLGTPLLGQYYGLCTASE